MLRGRHALNTYVCVRKSSSNYRVYLDRRVSPQSTLMLLYDKKDHCSYILRTYYDDLSTNMHTYRRFIKIYIFTYPDPPPPDAKIHARARKTCTERARSIPMAAARRQCPRHQVRRGCEASAAPSAASNRTAAATAMAELPPTPPKAQKANVSPCGRWRSWQRVGRAAGGLV